MARRVGSPRTLSLFASVEISLLPNMNLPFYATLIVQSLLYYIKQAQKHKMARRVEDSRPQSRRGKIRGIH